MTPARPWNMRPDETAKAYQAFEVYRDMGPERSLERVGKALAKTRQALDGWSQRFEWTARARLTVSILPFSAIDAAGARMYKGQRASEPTSVGTGDQPEQGGATPTRTLEELP